MLIYLNNFTGARLGDGRGAITAPHAKGELCGQFAQTLERSAKRTLPTKEGVGPFVQTLELPITHSVLKSVQGSVELRF